MSLALVAVVIAPRVLRPWWHSSAPAFALAVGFAIVSLDWHFPSDVAGGYLVAAAWCFAGLAVVRSRDRAAPSESRSARSRSRGGWPGPPSLIPLVVAAWLALERLPRITGYAEGHTTFAVVAAATAALVVALVGAVLAAPGRR